MFAIESNPKDWNKGLESRRMRTLADNHLFANVCNVSMPLLPGIVMSQFHFQTQKINRLDWGEEIGENNKKDSDEKKIVKTHGRLFVRSIAFNRFCNCGLYNGFFPVIGQ